MHMSLDKKSDRELLEELSILVREDHKMIKGMHRRMKFLNALGILKWFIYVGVAVGLYTYLQPFFQSIAETYSNLREGTDAVIELRNNLPKFPGFSF
jgi:hypothetical protein